MKQRASLIAQRNTSRTRQMAHKVGIDIPKRQPQLPTIEQEETDTM
jgi:hypothetical protein